MRGTHENKRRPKQTFEGQLVSILVFELSPKDTLRLTFKASPSDLMNHNFRVSLSNSRSNQLPRHHLTSSLIALEARRTLRPRLPPTIARRPSRRKGSAPTSLA